MPYSINTEIGKANRKGRKKVYVLLAFDRKKIHIPTEIYFTGKNLSLEQSQDLDFEKNKIEKRYLDGKRSGLNITKELLMGEGNGPVQFIHDYIDELKVRLKGKIVPRRMDHYEVVQNKLDLFFPSARFSDLNAAFMDRFETWLKEQKMKPNTIASKISIFRAIINRAIIDKIVTPDVILGYKNPPKEKTIPTYLTETERNNFEKVVLAYGDTTKKRVGMYYLLSCFAGYRISDLYAFNYEEKVQDGRITIRAKKNGEIISMPVHEKLKPILEYVKNNPIGITENEFRKDLKLIASDAGINKSVHPHSGRHTFAMSLMAKGFTVDEVAEYLGDSPEVARIYARISPKVLDDKISRAFS